METMPLGEASQSEGSSEVSSLSTNTAQMLTLVVRKRKFIFTIVGACSLAAIIISGLLPESFQSTAVLLPETDKSKLGNLVGLSDIATLAGVNVGNEASLVKLYPTILRSEAVLKNVIYTTYHSQTFGEPVNLIQYWHIQKKTPEKDYEAALRAFRGLLDISVDLKTNVLSITMEEAEPQLTADIVNTVTAELDKFVRTKRSTSAGEQRKFIDGRLKEVKGALETSENALKEFREKNRAISGSPELTLQLERLMRDVQINSTLFIELKKQYEIARIEEVKNIPVINVMDAARPAANKASPMRGRMVIITFFLSLAGSVLYLYFNATYKGRWVQFLRFLKAAK